MFNTDNQPDLFDLAASALGCAPVNLIKVRQEGEQIVAILVTGQKFVFDPQSVGADVLAQVQAIVAQLAAPAAALPDSPAAAPAPALPAAPTRRKSK